MQGEGADVTDLQNVSSVLTVNSDIHVDPDLTRYYPDLTCVITDPRFTDAFDRYDASVRKAKRRYIAVGLSSVILAVLALEFEIVSLAVDAVEPRGPGVPRWISLLFPALAIVSVALIIWGHYAKLRRNWLVRVFLRERLRQWRHQVLLDGQLMDLARSDPADHKATLDRLWSEFRRIDRIGDGMFTTFKGNSGQDHYWFIAPTIPHDADVVSHVLELQKQLRLDYQLAFGEEKLAEGPGLSDFTQATQWLATTTLVAAVVVTGCLFISRLLGGNHHTLDVWLAAAAGCLAVFSLGTRAIRNGLTIPHEQRSYEEYINRCQLLRQRFLDKRGEDAGQWQVLVDLETNAADELRRFLRMKWDSRFVL
jgi:hypothetical protein